MSPSFKTAVTATLHCLTGCAIGEVLGMVIGTVLGWHDIPMILLAVILAFLFGYGFTMFPLLSAGLSLKKALSIGLAADTVSIATMELVDNGVVVAIPGALNAGLDTVLFWGSLTISLVIAFIVTVPVNYWLIKRGKGHAVVHSHHSHHH